MIKLLSREEQETLHHQYRNDDVFRQWSPILCKQEWERGELDLINIWWQTELCIQSLRQEKDYRDEMIPYLFRRLLKDYLLIETEEGQKVRTPLQAELTAVTVMSVLMFRLMNAAEKGHEEEEFENRPMCVEIANLLRNHRLFISLTDDFFKRAKDNNGKKIVIKPNDPMDESEIMRSMDEAARKEFEEMKEKVLSLTQGLNTYFGELWTLWVNLINKVCMDVVLLKTLQKVEPNRNDWGVNQKMICNMIGIFRDKKDVVVTINQINKAISEKNISSYLRNHSDYDGTDGALTKEQHKQIEAFIDDLS